jgi:hypothetical protein
MKRDAALWIGLLVGPVAWLISLETNFALTDLGCGGSAKFSVYIVSFAALMITAGAGLLSWSQWRRLGVEVPGDGAGSLPRARLMAMGGVLLNGFMWLTILAQVIAAMMLGACE